MSFVRFGLKKRGLICHIHLHVKWKFYQVLLIWIADCMQFLSENCLNRCEIFGQFGFLNWIPTDFWFFRTPLVKSTSVWLRLHHSVILFTYALTYSHTVWWKQQVKCGIVFGDLLSIAATRQHQCWRWWLRTQHVKKLLFYTEHCPQHSWTHVLDAVYFMLACHSQHVSWTDRYRCDAKWCTVSPT